MGQLFSLDAARELGGRAALVPGARAERPSRHIGHIANAGGPEAPMVVEFFGLTESEQRAAINAFPGGRRFVLVRRNGETVAH